MLDEFVGEEDDRASESLFNPVLPAGSKVLNNNISFAQKSITPTK